MNWQKKYDDLKKRNFQLCNRNVILQSENDNLIIQYNDVLSKEDFDYDLLDEVRFKDEVILENAREIERMKEEMAYLKENEKICININIYENPCIIYENPCMREKEISSDLKIKSSEVKPEKTSYLNAMNDDFETVKSRKRCEKLDWSDDTDNSEKNDQKFCFRFIDNGKCPFMDRCYHKHVSRKWIDDNQPACYFNNTEMGCQYKTHCRNSHTKRFIHV